MLGFGGNKTDHRSLALPLAAPSSSAVRSTTLALALCSLRPSSPWFSRNLPLPLARTVAAICRPACTRCQLDHVTARWHAVESGARCHEPHEPARHRGASAAMLQCGAACFDCRAQPPAPARVAAPATGRRQCSAHLLMMMNGGGDVNCTLRSLLASCVGVVFSQRGCSSAFNPDIEYFLFRFDITWPWIADVVNQCSRNAFSPALDFEEIKFGRDPGI